MPLHHGPGTLRYKKFVLSIYHISEKQCEVCKENDRFAGRVSRKFGGIQMSSEQIDCFLLIIHHQY
jgi:hypothetical protein